MKTTAVGEVEMGDELQDRGVDDELVRVESAVYRVARTYRQGGQPVVDPEVEEEELEVQGFVVEPAHVGLRVNQTVNMGNYWSTSVQVSYNTPCYREEKVEAFDHVSDFVAERLEDEVEKAMARVDELRNSRGPGKGLF